MSALSAVHDFVWKDGGANQIGRFYFQRICDVKKTSKENGRAIPGASIELMWERLTLAFSASCSCESPRIFLNAEIAIPNWTNLSRFLNSISLLICITCRPYAYNYTLTKHKTLHLSGSKWLIFWAIVESSANVQKSKCKWAHLKAVHGDQNSTSLAVRIHRPV